MKKLLIFILSFLLFLPAMAQYTPIEKSKSKEYRNEMNQTIDAKIPIYKKEMVKLFDEFKEEQKLSKIRSEEEYTLIEDEIIFRLYFDLIDITEKYVGQDALYNKLASDDFTELYCALEPYFKDNKINTSKIKSFFEYIKAEHKKLKKTINYKN